MLYIVPCSLTQDKVKGHGKSSLPVSDLLVSAFQGKSKKRPLSTSSGEVSELVHKASKKQKVHDGGEEGDGGGRIDSEAEGKDVGLESGEKPEAAVKSKNSGLTGVASGGSFSRFSPQHTTATQVQFLIKLLGYHHFFLLQIPCSYSVMFVCCHVCVLSYFYISIYTVR